MSKYEYVNIDQLDGRDTDAAGYRMHEMVRSPETKRLLRARNLFGVVRRHSVSHPESVKQLHELQRTAVEQKMAAFIILDSSRHHFNTPFEATVGMATVQDGLPLNQHHLPGIPGGIARKAGLVNAIATPAKNVTAWFGHEDAAHTLREDITDAYGFLHLQASESWTLATQLPTDDLQTEYHLGLTGADYWPITDLGRYDDVETRWEAPQMGRVYMAVEDFLG